MPAHSALPMKQFLANKHITTREKLLYSPDLALHDFFHISKMKFVFKGRRSESVDGVKKKTNDRI